MSRQGAKKISWNYCCTNGLATVIKREGWDEDWMRDEGHACLYKRGMLRKGEEEDFVV